MEDLKTIIESLLFVADKPMSVEKLAEIIEEADTKAIRAALEALLDEFNNPGRGFRLHEVAGGYQFRTHPECQAYIRRMLKPSPSRLSRAALETLAIIAYKQPIIRSDIEHIRGVDSGGVLRVLMEKKLIRVLGRREIPGRPLIYATTKHFLEVFDLKNLKDLPTPREIEELTAQEPELEDLPDGGSQPQRASSETEATVTDDGQHTDAVTPEDGWENAVSGEEASAGETPDLSPAPINCIGDSRTHAAEVRPYEAISNGAVAVDEVIEGLDDATDLAMDVAPDQEEPKQGNDGKALDDNEDSAV